MRKLKNVMSLLLLGMMTFTANAQDERHPWIIGVGVNSVHVANSDISGLSVKNYYSFENANFLPVFSRAFVGRYLGKGFTADFTGSVNTVGKIPSGKVLEKSYMSTDLGLRYDLNKWKDKDDNFWFDPYIKASVGAAWIGGDFGAMLSPSLGFNTWISENIGINIETGVKTSEFFNGGAKSVMYVPNHSHFQHSISLVLKFGAKDSDDDGIIDKEDACPKIAGPVALLGCPDADDDGVPDEKDQCPQDFGPKELFGCPDADNDGIADKDDACQDIPGVLKFKGCPDTDNDGIVDSEDVCPTLAGLAANKGCPDSDKDGLTDNVDKCPKSKGPIENNGCPWPDMDADGVPDKEDKCIKVRGSVTNEGCPVVLTAAAKKQLGAFAKSIEFNSGVATFKEGTTAVLDNVVAVMLEFDSVKFNVEGHTDNQGNADKNLQLSKDRAQAVVDYFKSKGIAEWRLSSVGYGHTKPIASNKTKAGMALNRRVVLNAVE